MKTESETKMNPTIKRCLLSLLGIFLAGASTKYPAYAPILTTLGGLAGGAGAVTVHDAGHVSVLGMQIGKK